MFVVYCELLEGGGRMVGRLAIFFSCEAAVFFLTFISFSDVRLWFMFPDDLASAVAAAATTGGTIAVSAARVAATCGDPTVDAIGPVSSKNGAKSIGATADFCPRNHHHQHPTRWEKQTPPLTNNQQPNFCPRYFVLFNGDQFYRETSHQKQPNNNHSFHLNECISSLIETLEENYSPF